MKINEIIKFGIVGVIATLVHYIVYFFLLKLNLHPSLSFSIGYILSWFLNFYLSAHFTFRTETNTKKGAGFAMCHLVNYLMQICCLSFFIKVGVSSQFAPLPVYCVCIPINFLLVRFVFKSSKFK